MSMHPVCHTCHTSLILLRVDPSLWYPPGQADRPVWPISARAILRQFGQLIPQSGPPPQNVSRRAPWSWHLRLGGLAAVQVGHSVWSGQAGSHREKLRPHPRSGRAVRGMSPGCHLGSGFRETTGSHHAAWFHGMKKARPPWKGDGLKWPGKESGHAFCCIVVTPSLPFPLRNDSSKLDSRSLRPPC